MKEIEELKNVTINLDGTPGGPETGYEAMIADEYRNMQRFREEILTEKEKFDQATKLLEGTDYFVACRSRLSAKTGYKPIFPQRAIDIPKVKAFLDKMADDLEEIDREDRVNP